MVWSESLFVLHDKDIDKSTSQTLFLLFADFFELLCLPPEENGPDKALISPSFPSVSISLSILPTDCTRATVSRDSRPRPRGDDTP